jgi:hypothetical protein
MAIRTPSVLSHPPGVKPQRPSLEIQPTPANAQLQHTSTTYIKNTHRHPHNTEIHAGKTASVYIKITNACLYKVFLSMTCNKVSALPFCSLLACSLLSLYNSTTTK